MTDSRRGFLQTVALAGATRLVTPSRLGAQDVPTYLPTWLAITANVIGAYTDMGALYAPTFVDHGANVSALINYLAARNLGPSMADAAVQTLRANPAILDQAPYFLGVGADNLGVNVGKSFTNLYANPGVDFVTALMGNDLNLSLQGYTATLGSLANQLNNAGGFVASRRVAKRPHLAMAQYQRPHLVLVQQQQKALDAATAGVIVSTAGVLVGVGAVFVAAGLGAALLLGGGAVAIGSGVFLVAVGLAVATAAGYMAVDTMHQLLYENTRGVPAGSMPGDCNGPASSRPDSCPTPDADK